MDKVDLGSFSLSLNVRDVQKSIEFYQILGFETMDGGHTSDEFPDTEEYKWRILKSESLKIGLFQGMLTQNVMTFNPSNVFTIQYHLKENGISIIGMSIRKRHY